jgi:hypothetical protein
LSVFLVRFRAPLHSKDHAQRPLPCLQVWLPVNVVFVLMCWPQRPASLGVAMITIMKNLTNLITQHCVVLSTSCSTPAAALGGLAACQRRLC